ncbi:hypothetical protein KA005_81610 [bacterium]|nr:hypothetical protein [bacterium]
MRGEHKALFLNKTVRLVKSDGFVLTGKILRMDKDNILFETDQATSLIATDHIKELVLKKEGNEE